MRNSVKAAVMNRLRKSRNLRFQRTSRCFPLRFRSTGETDPRTPVHHHHSLPALRTRPSPHSRGQWPSRREGLASVAPRRQVRAPRNHHTRSPEDTAFMSPTTTTTSNLRCIRSLEDMVIMATSSQLRRTTSSHLLGRFSRTFSLVIHNIGLPKP